MTTATTKQRVPLSPVKERLGGVCEWSYADSNAEFYETTCKRAFFFETGTAPENGFRFCPFCGRTLKELKS